MVESTVFKTEHDVFLFFGRYIMHLKIAQNNDVLIVTPGVKDIKKRNRKSLEKNWRSNKYEEVSQEGNWCLLRERSQVTKEKVIQSYYFAIAASEASHKNDKIERHSWHNLENLN